MPINPSNGPLEALLDFYVEAGIDCALDDEPHDRFAESLGAPAHEVATPLPAERRPLERAVAPARPAAARSSLAASALDLALVALAAAREATTLDELKTILEAFEGCSLRLTAKNLCFADGDPAARLMLVGEAPGAEEDRMGLPFVGKSGQLLDRMLAAIGLDRSSVYIANLVPWRPPGNRTPTPHEAAICRPFIDRQIELADPDILVSLGQAPTQALFDAREGITRVRGRWFAYETGRRAIRGFATLHPAYLLRQPLQKRLAWRDFRALRRALSDLGPT